MNEEMNHHRSWTEIDNVPRQVLQEARQECADWQARWDKLMTFMEAEHDRLETEQYHEGDEGNYDTARERQIQKLQTWDILNKARAIRDEPAATPAAPPED